MTAKTGLLGWARVRLGQDMGRLGLRGAALAAVLALIGGNVSAVAQQSRTEAVRAPTLNYDLRRDCFAPLDRTRIPDLDWFDPGRPDHRNRLAEIIRQCSNPTPQRGLVYAYFYAAKANRILGEGPLTATGPAEIADPAALTEAARLFEVASGMASAPGGDANLLIASKSELARVYRLQRRYDDARRVLDEIAASRFGQLDRATLYERAMITLRPRTIEGQTQADNDATLLSAMQDLRVFSTRDSSERPNLYVIRRGPRELASLATRLARQRLGDYRLDARNRPPSLDDTNAALGLLNDAKNAYEVLQSVGGATDGDEASRISVSVGMLNLYLASLLGETRASRFDCSPGAEPRAVDSALRAFTEALRVNPNSAEAHWGRGCALATRQEYADAESSFQSAISYLGSRSEDEAQVRRSEYYLQLAQAQGAQGEWAGPNGALANFETAQSIEQEPNAKVAILLQTARAYLRTGRPADARQSLDRAVGLNRDNARALMMRGELALCPPPPGVDVQANQDICPPGRAVTASDAARGDLRSASTIVGGHQPRANYLLARLEEQAQVGEAAVQYATVAYLSDRSNPDYRRQACITRIRFGRPRRGPDQAQSACLADASADAEALFYEGVFWLREAYFSRGGNQENYWGQAIRAFNRGKDAPGAGGFVSHNNWTITYTDALNYGVRYALHCAGLESANEEMPGDSTSTRPRELFRDRYGLGRCWN